MRKMTRAMISFVLTAMLLTAMCITAFAKEPSITFNGFADGFDFQPGSEYTETDLFGSFKNVMPGDTVTETITFTNAADDCDFVYLYMRAEPHDETTNPLSSGVAARETVASMADFLSQLSMRVWNGAELIYEASPDETDGLTENKFLGMFRTGETATLRVELVVPIEMSNEYANRAGEVDWVFHVEAYNESQLSVRKLWSDGNAAHADDSITVNLLRDGEVADSQELNAENGWAFTFDRLLEGHVWTVEEAEVPEGYTVSYDTVGTMTTITNTRIETPPEPPQPPEPVDITARKVWSGNDGKERPDSVTVTLYDGEVAYESVRLGAWNNWTHTWEELSASGNWQVIETNIPKGYVPSYRVSGDVVTITNTRSLIQTGQLNWPIAVLGGTGLVLIFLGLVVLTKRKKENNA